MRSSTVEKRNGEDYSVIALDRFIQATRDSGYKGTVSAVSEIIDNAVEAGAENIDILIESTEDDSLYPTEIFTIDDGCGMSPATLRQALRFGGSTRFGSRAGLGRYGMGLPNSSLSQARRVTVFTWQTPGTIHSSHLDVDEIASGEVSTVPRPSSAPFPLEGEPSSSGTIVLWSHCDRLDARRVTTLERKLAAGLGRRFRHFIWNGVCININGQPVTAIDPLYLRDDAVFSGAEVFGEPIEYEVRVDPTNGSTETGLVTVTFSILPVDQWHNMTNQEKRRRGISKGAGVSIVRAGREVDYGWFFLRGKRRENYDDWWRCEVRFDPALDEAFGITHTKQQIRPKPYLVEALAPDIETVARALNGRVRKAHLAAKAAERFADSERLASERDALLEPLPTKKNGKGRRFLEELKRRHGFLRASPSNGDTSLRYRIVESTTQAEKDFYSYARGDGELVLVVNPDHPFYKHIYRHLAEGDTPKERLLRTQIELLLLSAARAEAEDEAAGGEAGARHRRRWSDVLATFLNG